MFKIKNSKCAFTIVELVIVIAVIAILAAVLIPTFSIIIKKANISHDVSTVTNINKSLAIEYPVNEKPDNADTFIKTIEQSGTKVPIKPKYEKDIFYWLPNENRVVLYNSIDGIIAPKEYKELSKDSNWLNLCENKPGEPENPTPQQSEDNPETEGQQDNPQTPEEEKPAENNRSFGEIILDIFKKIFGF